jgi:hypothetical protein
MAHELGTRTGGAIDARHVAASTARHNAIPLTLIGLGIGWLVARRMAAARRQSYHTSVHTDWSDDPWTEDEWNGGNRRLSTGEGSTSSSTRERASDMIASTRDKVRGAATRGGESMSSAARRTRNGLARALHNNPLALGVAMLAAGLAVGALLPHTETEDVYLGAARDTMLQKAQSAMEQTGSLDSRSQPSSEPSA